MADYNKFVRDNDAALAGLLGEFDADDKYVIDPIVLQELVKINKLITQYKEKYIICHAEVDDFKINFQINFADDAFEGKRYSSLYVKESYTSLSKQFELVTFVASSSQNLNAGFMEELKQTFNLLTLEDLGEGKSIKSSSELLKNLLNGKRTVTQLMINEMSEQNRKYINDILKILRNTEQFEILFKIYKERVSKLKIENKSAKYFDAVKKILDELVLEHYTEFSEEARTWLDKINKDYMAIYNQKKAKVIAKPEEKKKIIVKKKESKASKRKPFKHSYFEFKFNNNILSFDPSAFILFKKEGTKVNDKPKYSSKNQYMSKPFFKNDFINNAIDSFEPILQREASKTLQDLSEVRNMTYAVRQSLQHKLETTVDKNDQEKDFEM